ERSGGPDPSARSESGPSLSSGPGVVALACQLFPHRVSSTGRGRSSAPRLKQGDSMTASQRLVVRLFVGSTLLVLSSVAALAQTAPAPARPAQQAPRAKEAADVGAVKGNANDPNNGFLKRHE